MISYLNKIQNDVIKLRKTEDIFINILEAVNILLNILKVHYDDKYGFIEFNGPHEFRVINIQLSNIEQNLI